jgi:hypothetical protein
VTFSLEGSDYHSTKVALAAVEEYGNQPSRDAPAGFERLEYPTPFESAAVHSYDRSPWAEPDLLPFLDVANRIVVSGSSFSPGLLQGLTMQQIATDLQDSSGGVAQAVLGAANQITAAICAATGQSPSDVCSTPGVDATSASLGLTS